jgi:hypothetical protein
MPTGFGRILSQKLFASMEVVLLPVDFLSPRPHFV